MIRIAITLAALMMVATTAAAADLSGRARAVDGDTIRVGSTTVRIWGLAAPERSEAGGREATAVMADLLARGPVTCRDTGDRSHNRVVAVCTVAGVDIAAEMVASGWARDCPTFSGGVYGLVEAGAARRLPLPGYCERRK
jgi:endonuclease YncB( thermonuclease family)